MHHLSGIAGMHAPMYNAKYSNGFGSWSLELIACMYFSIIWCNFLVMASSIGNWVDAATEHEENIAKVTAHRFKNHYKRTKANP